MLASKYIKMIVYMRVRAHVQSRTHTTPRQLIKYMRILFSEQTVDDCKVNPRGEMFAIEVPQLLEERNAADKKRIKEGVPKRRRAVICSDCNDDQTKECKECGCKVCGGKHDSHHLLLCDECNSAFHLQCLNPPLTALPSDDYWYCPSCKRDENEIVKVHPLS